MSRSYLVVVNNLGWLSVAIVTCLWPGFVVVAVTSLLSMSGCNQSVNWPHLVVVTGLWTDHVSHCYN